MRRVHLKISGLVQGVFYRANTEKMASKLALTGWVRNTEDGGVEAVAEGEQEELERFIAWCKEGPSASRVDKVDVKWEDAKNEFGGFNIRY